MSTDAIVEEWERELIVKSTRDVLLRQIRRRFGGLDATMETRIAKATADELDRWVDRVVVAERVDDVFGE